MEEERKIIKLENWRNLFKFDNWRKEIIWIIIILLLVYSYWAYRMDMRICLDIVKDPCSYCRIDIENEKARLGGTGITFNIPNISKFKEVNNSLNAT